MDAAYLNAGNCNAPTVTMSGLGAAPVAFTMALNTDWQKFDLSATNESGFDGNFTLTTSATPKAIATGTIYLGGVPDAPFVTKVRHFGFLFDESNAARTINPIIQVSESSASAYTGVTVNPITPSITVGAGTVDTWRKLYDYYQYWACENIADAVLLTSTDGVNFNLPTTCKLTWPSMPSSGTLVGGWLQLTSPASYNYNLSGTKIEFTTAGIYDMSGTKFGATVELVNSSAGPVSVSLPNGASYTISGDITILTPQVQLTLVDFPVGSDIIILEAGTSNIIDQVDQHPSSSYTYSYATLQLVDIGILKAGYKPKYIRSFQLTAVSSTLPVVVDIDRTYLA